MEFKVRGGRKEIIPARSPWGLPPGVEGEPKRRSQRPLVVALARAHKWRQTVDSGEVASLGELAERYGVDRSYVGRILKLAALAPEIVASVLTGIEPEGPSLRALYGSVPVGWDEQRARFS